VGLTGNSASSNRLLIRYNSPHCQHRRGEPHFPIRCDSPLHPLLKGLGQSKVDYFCDAERHFLPELLYLRMKQSL
jgi:hypothetical protein